MKPMVIFACCISLLSACAEMPKGESPKLVESSTNTSEALIFARRFSDLSADAQKKEYTQVTQALSKNRNDGASRIKAALIYSLPGSRYRDSSKALTLLDEIQRDRDSSSDAKALASLLRDSLNDSIKLTQKAKDEQKRAETLQQKLDELKNIEKAITERDQASHK